MLKHAYSSRPKLFTDGRQAPVDRNDRARVIALAHAARRRGELTRAAVDVLRALLFRFANLTDGRCIPGYKRLAEAAGCAERTVGRCIQVLERTGFITWAHRLRRTREGGRDLFGRPTDWRVMRTSNSYRFVSIAKREKPAILDKGHFGSETRIPDLFSSEANRRSLVLAPEARPIKTGGVRIGPELAALIAAMATGCV